MSKNKPIVDKWISVDERMPNPNVYVLIKTTYCRYKAAVGFFNGTDWLSCEREILTSNVEYWAELNID